MADTDEEALAAIKTFLSYLPSHHNEAPPERPVPPDSGEAMAGIARLLPEKRTQVYDVRTIVRAIVDTGSFFELKARFGKVAVTGLARLDGRTRRHRRQQSAVQGRRDGHRRLREDHQLPGAVRQLQHPDRHARRQAGLLDRHRGRAQARARARS